MVISYHRISRYSTGYKRVLKNTRMDGLFKNGQMQGVQNPRSEAYMEIHRATRFAAKRSR
jgi:hypothetical protein